MRKVMLALFLFACVLPVNLAQGREAPNGPWRIAYVEGGPFSDYWRVLQGLVQELEAENIIEDASVRLPLRENDTRIMWDWLVKNAGGTLVHFLEDGFYSTYWDNSTQEDVKNALLERIRSKNDVDIILAFGTWAGQALAREDLDVPIIVASVTNALEAGIIASEEDSGRDNLTAAVELDRYYQQVTLFHDIFQFKKLGIVYEDSPAGRDSIALQDIEKAAQHRNVTMVPCINQFDIPDLPLARERLRACHQTLVDKDVDAVYVTFNTGMQEHHIAEVLEPLSKAGIPTFSQAGSHEVEQGVLLSISQAGLGDEGAFSAKALQAIIHGAKPRDLPQRFESAISLSMNLRMATLVGWNPSLEILAAIDEIYRGLDNEN